jgi:ABC-2 type transport system ATP-binding protein
MHATVSVQNLVKTYDKGKVLAVDKVSFDVKAGELFGLIGADGAGKSTIFRILTTVLLADSGTATLAGYDVVKDYREIRNRVGYMPGKFSLYQDLTIQENLEFFATVFGTTIEANMDLIKDIYDQIKPFGNRRAGKLSGGMKQKLALCCALIHKPEVLMLDEPTTGVDVVSRKEFWEMLKKLKAQGITIIVSTPYMDEAKLCERIALIQNGRIMSVDTPRNIIDAYPEKLFAAKSDDIYKLLKDFRSHSEVKSCFAFGEFIHVSLRNEPPASPAEALAKAGQPSTANRQLPPANRQLEILKRIAAENNHTGIRIKEIEPGIEDSFILLMSQNDTTVIQQKTTEK